jgi:ABC-type iron transport system FetAB permease component
MNTLRTVFYIIAAVVVAIIAWSILTFVAGLVFKVISMLVTLAIIAAVIYVGFTVIRNNRQREAR